MWQAQLREVEQRAAAQIDDKRHLGFLCQRCERCFWHRGSKTLDSIIAGMNFHDHRRARIERRGIIFQVHAISRADFAELRAGRRHHLRDSKRTPNFNQLTACDNHGALPRERIQHQHHRCRVVVDDRRRFSPRQTFQPLLNMRITITPLAGR